MPYLGPRWICPILKFTNEIVAYRHALQEIAACADGSGRYEKMEFDERLSMIRTLTQNALR